MPDPFFVTVVNAGGGTEAPALIATLASGDRVLFNAPEGLQRMATERRQRLARVRAVCVTACDSRHVSGLGGALLTVWEGAMSQATALAASSEFCVYIG